MIRLSSFWHKIAGTIFFIFICGAISHAAVVDDIAGDFKPIAGYVVMSEGDEYIIDLDKTQGISTGDIFSVISPGKKIVHPVTQKVLGTLEGVKAILKVTRIKSGFSFARAVGKSRDIKRGDPIRRYSNLPTIFWDYTGEGKPVFVQLQKVLPDLKWQDYAHAQRTRPPKPAATSETLQALTFILNDNVIEVRDPEFFVLRSYDMTESLSQLAAPPSSTAKAAVAAAPVIAAVPSKPEAGTKTTAASDRQAAGAKSVFPVFAEVQTVANMPSVSMITDFINHKDQLLMASTNGSQIQIFDVASNLKRVAEGVPNHPLRILSLKWWTPDSGNRLYLAANMWSERDEKIRGGLFLLDGDNLRSVVQKIPRILGSFDLNSDGLPETLFGQQFDGETFFGRRLNELKLSGDKISYVKPKIKLPRHFTVLGSVFADLTGDGALETVYIRNKNLYIYSGKQRLYKSPKEMGGSISFLTYTIDPNFKDMKTATVAFEVSPVVTDLDGDGRPEVLSVASDRDFFGTVSVSPGIKHSWLAIFKFQNGRFESGTLGDQLDKPLQGLTVAQQRVLMVATEPGNLLGEGAQSHLLAYSLAQ